VGGDDVGLTACVDLFDDARQARSSHAGFSLVKIVLVVMGWRPRGLRSVEVSRSP
jgi:hypothetical protein